MGRAPEFLKISVGAVPHQQRGGAVVDVLAEGVPQDPGGNFVDQADLVVLGVVALALAGSGGRGAPSGAWRG